LWLCSIIPCCGTQGHLRVGVSAKKKQGTTKIALSVRNVRLFPQCIFEVGQCLQVVFSSVRQQAEQDLAIFSIIWKMLDDLFKY